MAYIVSSFVLALTHAVYKSGAWSIHGFAERVSGSSYIFVAGSAILDYKYVAIKLSVRGLVYTPSWQGPVGSLQTVSQLWSLRP